jgi:hypothetical protein
LAEKEGRSEEVREQMKDLSVCKRETTKHWFVSAIANSKKAMGHNQHEFCFGIA